MDKVPLIMLLHILAGLTAVTAGFVALAASKGERLHREVGKVFAIAMLCMAGMGAVIAALVSVKTSVVAGIFTCYLVSTSILTLRRPANNAKAIDTGLMLVALAASAAYFSFGFEALASPGGHLDKVPPGPIFFLGTIALLAAGLDARMILAGGVKGPHRIARHLWRMTFAMFIATGSLFLGQARVFPDVVRKSGLLAIPVLVVVVLLAYYLVRVLFTRWSRVRAARAGLA